MCINDMKKKSLGRMSKPNITSEFLIRIIKKENTPEEYKYFTEWQNLSVKNEDEFNDLKLFWDGLKNSPEPQIPDAVKQFEKIKRKINEIDTADNARRSEDLHIIRLNTENPLRDKNSFLRERYSNPYSSIIRAAAIILMFVSGYFIFSSSNEKYIDNPEIVLEQQTNEYYEYYTKPGQKSTVNLSDGSTVFLNSGSKLKFPKYFSSNSREVELSGEAYFQIQPDKNRPFTVITGETVTLVTGTEFNIKYRDSNFNLVVSKGSVKSYRQNKPEIAFGLRPGDMISYNNQKGFSSPKKVQLSYYTAWRQNKLGFDNTSLEDVMKEVELRYNIKSVFTNNSHKTRTLTGIFTTENLNSVLSVISMTMDVNIRRHEDKIVIN